MKRKLSSLFMLGLFGVALTSCKMVPTLLFLNWGEYIDETLLDKFEEEYNCRVLMDLGDSNEIFYQQVRSGTTVYDVVCPSDYAVEKMYEKNLLQPIDWNIVTSYNPYTNDRRMPGVKSIAGIMEEDEKDFSENNITDYYVPYLWGTWGIMYSTDEEKNPGLKDAMNTLNEEGKLWNALFDRSSLPEGTRVSMYQSSQHAYYAACKYLGYDHKVEFEKDSTELSTMLETIKKMNYNGWGTDDIKKNIVAGNKDVGFMWTGDFLYYYCENATNRVMDTILSTDLSFDELGNFIDELTKTPEGVTYDGKNYQVGFDLMIPDDTIAFCDNLVIPADSTNVELANEFINFMSSYSFILKNRVRVDESNPGQTVNEVIFPSYDNTYYVCYNAVFTDVYDDLAALSEQEFDSSDKENFDYQLLRGYDAYDTDLYYKIYDYVTGIAFTKYYNKDQVKGSILNNFSRKYIDRIDTLINNSKA